MMAIVFRAGNAAKSYRLSSVVVITFIAFALSACGTDFAEPEPVAAISDTPVPQATVFRVLPVTPVATSTPLPPPIGIDGKVQKEFPSQIDPSRSSVSLPPDAVLGFWAGYLSNTRLIVEGQPVDVHLCEDRTLFPGSPSTFVNAGTWALRPGRDEAYEVTLGREWQGRRISGFVHLSRVGGQTVATNDGLHIVSVTESDLCDELGDL